MMSEGAESASYQGRLVEIFQSCDSANKGYLSLFEFERLCRQLQLQHQKQRLYKDLGLGRASGNTKVYFEDFKAALLSLLQEVGPETLASGELNPVSTPTGSPILKAIRPHGNQKRPSVGDDDLRLDLPADMTDNDISYPPSPNKRQPPRGKSSPTGPLKRAFLEVS
ncbi:uncharacterized protein [Littorina saxatilis]|uniref:uncharacterized protein n=1 Tax=Littorina saxatilis TaxID=31220 RepID=UPI0038B4D8A3